MSDIDHAPRKAVLVTGAARRIGAAIARGLHDAGYDVALHCQHSLQERDALIAQLEARRAHSTLGLQADLADVAHLPQLVEATVQRFGRLDGLVNNASSFYATAVGSITPTQWDDLFAANARAPLFLSQAAAPHLAAVTGAIINLVDIHADRPLAGHSVYGMAKAALAMATRVLALDLAPAVRVNGVAPGAILWPEAGKPEATKRAAIERIPLKRIGTPDDIVKAVLWLLRDAHYVTGQIIAVDGGRSLS